MKTIKNKISKVGIVLALLLLIFYNMGCSKNDDNQEPFINAETATVTFTDVNTCTLSGNVTSTRFFTKIKFDASKGIVINKIIVGNEWSSGDISTPYEVTKFTIDKGELNFTTCYKFSNKTWAKASYTLVSNDGIESNPSVVTINKPSGAF